MQAQSLGERTNTRRWAAVAQAAIAFVWSGLVLGLSFIEAPLKFRAPGITRELGLGIGRLVFGALNRVEIGLAIAAFAALLIGKAGRAAWIVFALVGAIVVTQTAWLLPVLDARAELTIRGMPPPSSFHHVLFIVLEVTKVVALLGLGFVSSWRR
jgi:hypothetical protein